MGWEWFGVPSNQLKLPLDGDWREWKKPYGAFVLLNFG